MDEVCPNCECDLAGDCCGTRAPYRLDELDYCCEACAVDGECECGCIANPQPVAGDGQAQSQPIPGPGI
jgi:hypothetical protein